MFKRFIDWLDRTLTPTKTDAEERLIELHFQKFCRQLESYPHREQIFIKDTIIRMFVGIAIGEC